MIYLQIAENPRSSPTELIFFLPYPNMDHLSILLLEGTPVKPFKVNV